MRRGRVVGLLGASALLAALATHAVAKPSTEADVAKMMALFGFEQAMPLIIQQQLDASEELAVYSSSQRKCVADLAQPAFQKHINGLFRTVFSDGDHINAWLAFAQTPGGTKMLSFIRAGVGAKMKGAEAPQPTEFLGDMSLEEMMQVTEFMQSPAAGMLEQEFPDSEVPAELIAELTQQASQRCGVVLPEE